MFALHPKWLRLFWLQMQPPPHANTGSGASTLAIVYTLLLLLFEPTLVQASLHKWSRYLQETMLRNSLERAQINYDIFFECRTTSNMKYGDEAHFSLQLGDMRGFQRLDPRRKLALFLHGWNDEGSKKWVQDMLITWTHFDPNYSVCVVDWGHLSQLDYKTASMSIFGVGLTVAAIIKALEKLRPRHFTRRNVTIAGYSLGAHAAGYAGAMLDGEVEQIIGLDPAGPLFTVPAVVSTQFRLDETDARFVQVLHTSGGILGASLKMGHADFYPNGGTVPQKNCLLFLNLKDVQNTNPIACSHSTAAIFFKQSMNPSYPFIGQHCDSYKDYKAGVCAYNRRARFGIHSRRRSKGDFYFDTEPHSPYVRERLRYQQLLQQLQHQQLQQLQQQRRLQRQRRRRHTTKNWRRLKPTARRKRRQKRRKETLGDLYVLMVVK